MNHNPALIHAKTLSWIDKKLESEGRKKLTVYQREKISVRVYNIDSLSYFFIKGDFPNKWYFCDSPMSHYKENVDIKEVEKYIAANLEVQIVDNRGRNYGIWKKLEGI